MWVDCQVWRVTFDYYLFDHVFRWLVSHARYHGLLCVRCGTVRQLWSAPSVWLAQGYSISVLSLFGLVQSCRSCQKWVALCHCVIPYVPLCHCVIPCVPLCHCVIPCVPLCHCVIPSVPLCHCVIQCVPLCHCIIPCVSLCHPMCVTVSLALYNQPHLQQQLRVQQIFCF